MKLVIDIPERTYNIIINDGFFSCETLLELKRYIYNGVPLPKGHGRLGDLDERCEDWEER